MKHLKRRHMFRRTLLSTLCYLALVATAFAQDGKSDEFAPGFSGSLTLGVGVITSESLDEVSDENRKINSLDQSADSETEVMPLPIWHLQYVLENQSTAFYAGSCQNNPTKGGSILETGIRQRFSDGTVVSLAYIPSIGNEEVWADPFLTGSNRSETDQDIHAFTLALDSVFGTAFDIRYGVGTIDVDDEKSGTYLLSQPGSGVTASDLSSLDRSGTVHQVDVAYAFELGRTAMIQPALSYRLGDIDGEANAFNEYQGDLAIHHAWRGLHFSHSISLAYADYDGNHVVFDKTREDTTYSIQTGFQIPRVFGWESFDFTAMAGYQVTDSNISYYDANSLLLGMGLNWRF